MVVNEDEWLVSVGVREKERQNEEMENSYKQETGRSVKPRKEPYENIILLQKRVNLITQIV